MLDGFVFDQRNITSTEWSHYNWIFSGKKDGVTNGCALSFTGNNITIGAGYFMIRGRMGVLTGNTTVNAGTTDSATIYCLLVAEIDLTATNTLAELNQLTFKILKSTSNYPTPTQQDLDDDGTIYQLPFATFTLTTYGITNFNPVIPTFNATTTVLLPVNGWVLRANGEYEQTVNCDNVTAVTVPSYVGAIYPNPCTDAQRKAVQKALGLIVGLETKSGQVTFRATAQPTTALTIGMGV